MRKLFDRFVHLVELQGFELVGPVLFRLSDVSPILGVEFQRIHSL